MIMRHTLARPLLTRLLAVGLASLTVACTELPRRSGIVDSLNRVTFDPPPHPPENAAEAQAEAEAGTNSALPRAEIYGGGPPRPPDGAPGGGARPGPDRGGGGGGAP